MVANLLSNNLKSYSENKFKYQNTKKDIISNDSSIKYWEFFLNESADIGGFEILKTFYPQLSFPIEEGINKSENYIDMVFKGKSNINLKRNLHLNSPEQITVKIHDSIFEKIPVVIIPDEEDFRSIIQSFLHKNNPNNLPASMGACLVKGINNWSRLNALKKEWLSTNPFGNWNAEFSSNIQPYSNLYKDNIIILSTKPYSNISADRIPASETEWNSYSLSIRLEHECTHLYTLRKYGCASNNLHDELIADYVGISKTFGRFNEKLMLQFMGLENYPKYKEGSRFENYISRSEFSSEEFESLMLLIKNAIENISDFDSQIGKFSTYQDQILIIEALCETDLIELGSKNGTSLILKNYEKALQRFI
jgi:hypothetical protein